MGCQRGTGLLNKEIIVAAVWCLTTGVLSTTFNETWEGTSIGLNSWSSWSEWSECTRTCGGGVRYRKRTCLAEDMCEGADVEYDVCAIHNCPEGTLDFMDQQCQSQGKIRYKLLDYEWVGHYDPDQECKLICRPVGKPTVIRLSSQVIDGTPCRPGALDMCVGGTCMKLGCDLKLNSTVSVDICGFCGGNNSSCVDDRYTWKAYWTECSVLCGGGHKTSAIVCWDSQEDMEVQESHCVKNLRPKEEKSVCNTNTCPGRWQVEGWTKCSRPCGSGVRQRVVWCGREKLDYVEAIDSGECTDPKPLEKEPCNVSPCPNWRTGPWSECSATCGEGHQVREVVCKEATDHVTCDSSKKPEARKKCAVSQLCPQKYKAMESEEIEESYRKLQPLSSTLGGQGADEFTHEDPIFTVGPWGHCSVSCGSGIRMREVQCRMYLKFSQTVATLPDYRCYGNKPHNIESCDTGIPCKDSESRTLGMGSLITYEEPIKFDVSKLARPGWHNDNNLILALNPRKKYRWVQKGYTPCSNPCLGGVQESIVECVQIVDMKAVGPEQCDFKKKPDIVTKTCNDRPCPPQWYTGPFSNCTKVCGTGYQVREVTCVHQLARGERNSMIVSSNHCPNPPPVTRQECNIVNCPPDWNSGSWGKCSKPCGGGFKHRKLKCQQVLASGEKVTIDDWHCSKRSPKVTKPCNTRPCPATAAKESSDSLLEIFSKDDQDFIQTRSASKIVLNIGGRAAVFKGTNVVIKCPVVNYPRSQVLWLKDDKPLENNRHLKIRKKGVLILKRVSYKSSGVYMCKAKSKHSSIAITVRPDPHHMTSSEEKDGRRRTEVKSLEFSSAEDIACKDTSTICSKSHKMKKCRNAKYRQKCCATCTKYQLFGS